MKRILTTVLVGVFSVVGQSVFNTPKVMAFAGGNGTELYPFAVTSCSDLLLVGDALGAYYKLSNDIDCNETTFTGIGPVFTGTLDGQSYSIDALNISGSGVGLFQSTDGATVKNLTISSGTMEVIGNAGSIAGTAYNTTLTNVHSSMAITGEGTYRGGLVGLTDDGLIVDSSTFSGSLTASTYSGGLVGLMYSNTQNVISNSYFDGSFDIVRRTVPSDAAATGNGGLVGLLYGGDIVNSYSAGSINYANGTSYTGGLVGITYNGVFDNVFSAPIITGTSGIDIGAAFGLFYSSGGNTSVGTNLHFDSYLSGSDCAGFDQGNLDCTAQNAANSTPDYFKNSSIRPVFDTWDFSTVWLRRLNGYPTLRASTNTADLNGDGVVDVDQSNMGGYTSLITGKKVAIDVGEGCELVVDDMTQELSLAVQDPAYDFANGLWDFEADCPTPGQSTTIKLYYYGVTKDGFFVRKYNPNTNTYFNLTGGYGATLEDIVIDGQPVTLATYQITDGGVLDMDGMEDGNIVDPVGIATQVNSSLAATGSSTQQTLTLVYVPVIASMAAGVLAFKKYQ